MEILKRESNPIVDMTNMQHNSSSNLSQHLQPSIQLTLHQFNQQQNLNIQQSNTNALSGTDSNTMEINGSEVIQSKKEHQQATICDQTARPYDQRQHPYSVLINNKTIKGKCVLHFISYNT